MGRSPCCSKELGLNKGAWTALEDKILTDYIKLHGEGKWRNIPKQAGLKRCGKSCRLRWLNYLRPDIKRGNISHDEEDLIVRLHKLLGNRWSLIAGRLPGRTDNEIKNYWNTVLSKKAKSGNDEIKSVQIQSSPHHAKQTTQQNDVEPPAPVLLLESSVAKLESESDGSLSSTSDGEYLPDFALDYNHLVGGDDINLSEILYSDFGSDKNHVMDSDFGSLASFLESTEEWVI